MIANTIITATLRRLLVIPSGGTPSTPQFADALEVLNDMINMWSAQNDVIFEDTFEELAIPASTQQITIGPTGTLVTARPLKINIATLKSGDIEYPMRIISENEYPNWSNKVSTGQPYRVYYRNTWPNGTIYFEYTTDKAYTLILTSLKQLSTFPDGTTDVSLPDHYEHAFKTNLVIMVADEMGAGNRITQSMRDLAMEAKSAVIGQATSIVPSKTDIPSRGIYNIESDSY